MYMLCVFDVCTCRGRDKGRVASHALSAIVSTQ